MESAAASSKEWTSATSAPATTSEPPTASVTISPVRCLRGGGAGGAHREGGGAATGGSGCGCSGGGGGELSDMRSPHGKSIKRGTYGTWPHPHHRHHPCRK